MTKIDLPHEAASEMEMSGGGAGGGQEPNRRLSRDKISFVRSDGADLISRAGDQRQLP